MSIAAHRAIQRGRSAWMRGDLDVALESLERALGAVPRALEALYPLARVLAESGHRDRALAVLEQADALTPNGHVGRVFAAQIHYDYGEWARAREAIDGIEEKNVIARALRALLDLETERPTRLVLHRGALWISETAGRLLAALETRLFREGRSEANAFHEKLFTEGTDASSDSAPETDAPEEQFKVDRDWWAALERAFRTGDHDRVNRLYRRREVPDAWRDVISKVLGGYSLLAVGETKRALEASLAVVKEEPASAWAHFLGGLARLELDDRRHAIYSFVRAVQRSDIEMNHVIVELTKRLGISIEFLD